MPERTLKCSYCGAFIPGEPLILTREDFYGPEVVAPELKMAFCDESCKGMMKRDGWPLLVKETGRTLIEGHEKRMGPDWHT